MATGPGGVMAVETEALRVVLKELAADRYVRFLVLSRSDCAGRTSGRGFASALRAAERTLARMTVA